MNFYPFHLGDYISATAHLSILEDGVYRRLLDSYYLREGPLPADMRQVFRLVRAQSDQEREAVKVVLEEFFELADDGWRHRRCDAELARMKDKREKASQSANKRWSNAPKSDSALPPQTEGNANAQGSACERIDSECDGNATNTNTNTNKQTPRNPTGSSPRAAPVGVVATSPPPAKRRKPAASAVLTDSDLIDAGVDPNHARDWLTLRRAKKLPLTPSAWQLVAAQGAEAGLSPAQTVAECLSRSWGGFKAAWYRDDAARPAPRGGRRSVTEHNDRVGELWLAGSTTKGETIDG